MTNEIEIASGTCFRCAQGFEKKGDRKRTIHHSIPKSLKPSKNVLIPICESCHVKLHSSPKVSMKSFKSMQNALKGLKSATEKFENKLGTLE